MVTLTNLVLAVPQSILVLKRRADGTANKKIITNAKLTFRNRPLSAIHSLKLKANGLYWFPLRLLYNKIVDIKKRIITLVLNNFLKLKILSIKKFNNSKQQIMTANKSKSEIDLYPSESQILTKNGILYATANHAVK